MKKFALWTIFAAIVAVGAGAAVSEGQDKADNTPDSSAKTCAQGSTCPKEECSMETSAKEHGAGSCMGFGRGQGMAGCCHRSGAMSCGEGKGHAHGGEQCGKSGGKSESCEHCKKAADGQGENSDK